MDAAQSLEEKKVMNSATGPDMQNRGVVPFYAAGSWPVRGSGSHSYSK